MSRFLECAQHRALAFLLFFATAHTHAATLDVAVQHADVSTEVVLEHPDSGFRATSNVNSTGRARFVGVPAAQGYRVSVRGQTLGEGIDLRSNERRALRVRVADAAVENVLVTGQRNSLGVNALDAEVRAGLSQAELENLPVEARDLTRALIRLPNVVPSTGFFPEAPPVSINGANGLFTQYLVDGMDNNENFLGGPKFPISTGALSDVSVLAASYSAQFGRTGNGVINVTTRSGTNEWLGEAFYLTRPGAGIDASSPFAQRDLSGNAVRDGFRRDQIGFSVGGPLLQDRTFLFANVELTEDQKDNLLNAPELGALGVVPGENRTLLGSIKLDHVVNEDWRLALRINRGDVDIERQGGGLDGGVSFPSAGSIQRRDSTLAALSATFDRGNLTSETSLQFSRFDWDYAQPRATATPQVAIELPSGLTGGVLGHPGFAFDEQERSVQLQQKLTWLTDRHALKFGLDVLRSDFELAGGGNAAGNYRIRLTEAQLGAVRALGRGTALSVADLPLDAQVLSYAVELRPARFGDDQTQVGLYIEDQISLTQDLTLTAGLRWDLDSLTEAGSGSADRNNIAPRLALNYRAREDLAFRGGVGVYFEKLPYTVLSDALQQNTTSPAFVAQLTELANLGILPPDLDPTTVTFDGNLTVSPDCPGGFLQCPTPADAADLRSTAVSNERRLLNPDGLDSPFTVQFSLGAQWQLADRWLASADLLYYRGYRLLRLRDLNAPAPFSPNLANLTDANIATLRGLPDDAARRTLAESLGLIRSQAAADATRPIAAVPGGARQIVVTETDGESRYRALNLSVQKEPAGSRYGLRVAYTLSELTNNTDDINFRAANSNDFDDEWGPSVNDRRHVIAGVVNWFARDDLTLTLAAQLESGQPVNLIPDATIFGTTDLNGDGASFADAYLGNSDRAPGVSRNSDRLPWSITFDLGLRYQPSLGPGQLELSADVFNLLNRNNLSGFANSATQSNQIQVFGTPFAQRNAGAPRQFQFGLRYVF